MDMKDSCVGDEAKSSAENDFVMSTTVNEMPKNGDIQPFSKRCLQAYFRKRLKKAKISRPVDQAGETVLSKRVNRPKNFVSNGHGESSKTVDRESGYQDFHEIDHAKYDDMMIDEVGGTNVDQSLSLRLNILPPVGSNDSTLSVNRQDGSRTPPLNQENTMESSPLQKTDGDLPVKNLNQCAESNDKGGELGTPAIVSIDTVENEDSLPFVKRSPVWKYIDSMETFKKMTQKPHFSPLYEHMEETREGLAIAHMVNFLNLVEDTSKLKFSCDIAVIERGLENITEFKSHGFHVEKVEACLTQLLLKKQMAEELQKEYDKIKSEMKNSVYEGRLDEEISQLHQKLREIEKKLGEAKLKKETREKALSALQSKGDAVAKNVQSLEADFESIVGSLYG